MAERATVDLITIFARLTHIGEVDENGKRLFALPLSQINDENLREEQQLPIDKFDWLDFGCIFQNVFVRSEDERTRLCKIVIPCKYSSSAIQISSLL